MKRELLVFSFLPLFLFSFFFATARPVQAQGVVDELRQNQEAIFESQENANKEGFDYETLNNLGENMIGWMAGCTTETANCPPELAQGGALGATGKMIASIYKNKPADTQTYVADLMQNMGVAQPAYAQGFGFSSLQPILDLWKVFRDIAYIFFVFVFLIIGFAIMFRKNLGGQTAVTVQQALPRIIVSLLAVSFSYAIAGLLIDLMYVAMFFLIIIFENSGLLTSDVADLTNQGGSFILDQNIFQVFGEIITYGNVTSAGSVVGGAVENMLGSPDNLIADGLGWISGVLAALIIFFALVFAMFRTFFSLIKIYLEIILTIIFAPVILMLGAINTNAFGNWLKGLAANLAVFPVLLVFILIGQMFINTSQPLPGEDGPLSRQFDEAGFIPPFVPGRGQANVIGLIVGVAAVMLLPEVVGLMAKYKPQSVFADLGGKAVSNAFLGNQVAAPAVGGLAGGIVGGGLGAFAGYRQAGVGGALRGAWGGDLNAKGVRVGGARYTVPSWYGGGQSISRVIDRAREGKLLDPDIINTQLGQLRKSNDERDKNLLDKLQHGNAPPPQSGGTMPPQSP